MKEQVKNVLLSLIESKGNATTADVQHNLALQGINLTHLQVSKIITKDLKAQGIKNSIVTKWVRVPSEIETELKNLDATIPFSKKQLKQHLLNISIPKESVEKEFDSTFERLFEFAGTWNKENHKMYRLRLRGQHFSTTKLSVEVISEMHPSYIYNTIQSKYSKTLVKDCFRRDSEIYEMLRQYFLYDVKQVVQ